MVIPARSGSVRLPNKNMLRLGGRTLVEWAVSTGLRIPDRVAVVVSTDSAEIAEEARRCGAYAHMRTVEEADGMQSPALVGQLCLDWWEKEGGYELGRSEGLDAPTVTGVVLLQPTSPLRDDRDVAAVVERFEVLDVGSAWSCSRMGLPDGQVWVTRPDVLRVGSWVSGDGVAVPCRPCIDIDTAEDWAAVVGQYEAGAKKIDRSAMGVES